jgi:ketosteroid isomerase-like protein
MNKAIISIITFVVVHGSLLSCKTTTIPDDLQPNSTQEREVLEVFNKMVEARENQDFEAYMSFFDDDAKIFKRLHPGSDNGSFLNKKEYSESPGEEFSIRPMVSDIDVHIGEDIAILRCWNRNREVRSQWILDMEKKEGEWRVIKYDYTPYQR